MESLEERRVAALESIAYELKRANDSIAYENDKLVNCAEAASICGVTPQTISVWVRNGRLKKTHRNGRTGILLSDISKL